MTRACWFSAEHQANGVGGAWRPALSGGLSGRGLQQESWPEALYIKGVGCLRDQCGQSQFHLSSERLPSGCIAPSTRQFSALTPGPQGRPGVSTRVLWGWMPRGGNASSLQPLASVLFHIGALCGSPGLAQDTAWFWLLSRDGHKPQCSPRFVLSGCL